MRAVNVSPDGVAFIKAQEGLRLEPYTDAVGILTIGYGHARWTGGSITQEQADSLLATDLRPCEACVNARVLVPLTQGQFDALVSMVFNCGPGCLIGTHLADALNAGQYDLAATLMLEWCHGIVNGQKVVLPGLLARRQRERAMFLRDVSTLDT